MSLFRDLTKCHNFFCQQYVRKEEKDKYSYKGHTLCSLECAHLAMLSEYTAKDNFNMLDFFVKIREHFEKFREEVEKNSVSLFKRI